MQIIVSIEPAHDLAGNFLKSLVERIGFACVRFRKPSKVRVLLKYVDRAILRTAVYDDVFEVWIPLRDDALNAAADELATVIGRRDDRNFWPRRHGGIVPRINGYCRVKMLLRSGVAHVS